ncbi:MAG: hypothetical protein ACI9UK_001442 [Candidatus Krumholzibacteriia bacterium]|jgi:hypothetical protein
MKKNGGILLPMLLAIFAIVLSVASCVTEPDRASGVLSRKGKEPTVAVAPNGTIAIAYGYQDSLFYQQSVDHGATFDEPQIIGSLKNLPLVMGSGPQICVTNDLTTIIAPGNGGSLYAWTRDANETTWQGPNQINDIDGSAAESLVASTFVDESTVIAVWIDTRPMAADSGMEHAGHKDSSVNPATGEMSDKLIKSKYPDENGTLRWVVRNANGEVVEAEDIDSYREFVKRNEHLAPPKAKLFAALSPDGGITWGADYLIYASPSGSICECCKPSVVADDNGNVAVLFRNDLEGNRDMYLALSNDAGVSFGTAEKQGIESWPLNGCPMDGGSVAIDAAGNVQVIWQRKGVVYTGNAQESELERAKGKNGRVAVANNGLFFAWLEEGSVMLQTPGPASAELMGHGNALQLAANALQDRVVLVWSSDDQVQYSVQ